MGAQVAETKSIRTKTEIRKYVSLGLNTEKYGIDISMTREIIARFEIVPLPKTPDFIEGIISLRGIIIPVVNLRKRFELADKKRDNETRIIVVELRDCAVGIQVDRVYDVMRLDETDIKPPPPMVAGLSADYMEGVAEIGTELTTILNMEKMFSATEMDILKQAEKAGEVRKGSGAKGKEDKGG